MVAKYKSVWGFVLAAVIASSIMLVRPMSDLLNSDKADRNDGSELDADIIWSEHLANVDALSETCEDSNLQPLDTVWSLPSQEKAALASLIDSHSGDALAQYALKLYQNRDLGDYGRKADRRLMYLFRIAAEDHSAIAMNEIGASLLNCYQGIEQDIPQAQTWLKRAASLNDPLAMYSLGIIARDGLRTGQPDQEKADEWFRKCSAMGIEDCAQELAEN